MPINMNDQIKKAGSTLDSERYRHKGVTGQNATDDDWDDISVDGITPPTFSNMPRPVSGSPFATGVGPSVPNYLQGANTVSPQPQGMNFSNFSSIGMNNLQNTVKQPKTGEDIFFDVLKTILSVLWDFFKDVFKEYKETNKTVLWYAASGRLTVIGLVELGVASCAFLLGARGFVQSVLTGSIASGIGGVVVMACTQKKARLCMAELQGSDDGSSGYSASDFNYDDFTEVDEYEEEIYEEDEDDYELDDDLSFSNTSFDSLDNVKILSLDEIDAKLDLVDVDKGLVTRQYIWDLVMSSGVLPRYSPDFKVEREVNEDSDTFVLISNKCISALESIATGKSEEEPYVVSVVETAYYYQADIEVPRGLSVTETKFEHEVASYFKEKETDDGVYARAYRWQGKLRVKIYKGVAHTISLADLMLADKSFILDTKVKMPLALGVGSDVDIINVDFMDLYALLIAGAPRSGKTLFLQEIIAQLVTFNSPDDLIIYFLDPKNKMSDWYRVRTPHIKKFVTTIEDILATLQYVVRVEGVRRKEFMGNRGHVNVIEFNRDNPDEQIPLLLVVIDEAMTIAQQLRDDDIEKLKAYNGLLRQLVSELPGAGIRVLLIPHEVKDDVISKRVTDMIPCRASVRGDARHIKDTLGLTNAKFPFKLKHRGDVALNIDSRDPLYLRGPLIHTDTKGVIAYFDFIGKMWKKINPKYEICDFTKVLDKDTKIRFDLQSELSRADIEDLWDETEFETVLKGAKTGRQRTYTLDIDSTDGKISAIPNNVTKGDSFEELFDELNQR